MKIEKNITSSSLWTKIELSQGSITQSLVLRRNPEKKADARNAKIKMEIQKKIEKEITSCSTWTKSGKLTQDWITYTKFGMSVCKRGEI